MRVLAAGETGYSLPGQGSLARESRCIGPALDYAVCPDKMRTTPQPHSHTTREAGREVLRRLIGNTRDADSNGLSPPDLGGACGPHRSPPQPKNHTPLSPNSKSIAA